MASQASIDNPDSTGAPLRTPSCQEAGELETDVCRQEVGTVDVCGQEVGTVDVCGQEVGTVDVCKFFLQGRCHFGSRCRLAHSVSPSAENSVASLEKEHNVEKEKRHGKKGRKKAKAQRESGVLAADSREREPSKKPRMRPAEDVVSRILWDPSLDAEDFSVGYLDRFLGVLERSFSEFSWGSDLCSCNYTEELALPQHRIKYFTYKGIRVWDRETRLDAVFGSTGGPVNPLFAAGSDRGIENAHEETTQEGLAANCIQLGEIEKSGDVEPKDESADGYLENVSDGNRYDVEESRQGETTVCLQYIENESSAAATAGELEHRAKGPSGNVHSGSEGETRDHREGKAQQGRQSREDRTGKTEQGTQSTEQRAGNTEQGTQSREHRAGNTEQGTQNREHRAGNTEQGTQNREHRAGNTEQGTQSREHRAGNTEQGTQNREHRAGNTEQGTESREQRAASSAELDTVLSTHLLLSESSNNTYQEADGPEEEWKESWDGEEHKGHLTKGTTCRDTGIVQAAPLQQRRRLQRTEPTHFITFRADTPAFVSAFQRIQQEVTRVLPQCAPYWVPVDRLHVTLCLLVLSGPHELHLACEMLRQFARKRQGSPLTLTCPNELGHFGGRVLYLTPLPLEEISALNRPLQDECVRHGWLHRDSECPVYHLTLAKLGVRGGKRVFEGIQEKMSAVDEVRAIDFGKLMVNRLYLCSINTPRSEDGFYKIFCTVSI